MQHESKVDMRLSIPDGKKRIRMGAILVGFGSVEANLRCGSNVA